MSEASVSVIVATRDRPQLLRRTLESIAAQTKPVHEVVVVYDSSEVDDRLPAEFPDLVVRTITNSRTPGLCGARNSGIMAARGDWVAFCDDDDEWLPRKQERQLAVMEPGSILIVGGITVDNETRRVDRTPGERTLRLERLLRSRVMEAHPSTYMIKREALLGDLGLIDEDIPGGYYEDYDILLRAARLRPIDVADESVAIIYWHPQSFFRNRWEMTVEAIDYLMEKTPEFSSSRTGEARLLGQQAFALSGLGRRREALHLAAQTFKKDPLQLRTYLSLLVSLTPVKAEGLMRLANSVGRGI